MPDQFLHLTQAGRNEVLSSELAGRYEEWAVVAAFYSALHLIDAHLAAFDNHPKNHAQRRSAILARPELAMIAGDYEHVRRRADDARYELVPVRLEDVREHFERIKKRVRQLVERA